MNSNQGRQELFTQETLAKIQRYTRTQNNIHQNQTQNNIHLKPIIISRKEALQKEIKRGNNGKTQGKQKDLTEVAAESRRPPPSRPQNRLLFFLFLFPASVFPHSITVLAKSELGFHPLSIPKSVNTIVKTSFQESVNQ